MAHHHDDPTITVLTGAGISTGSGIPDFRGPDGLWTRHPDQTRLLELGPYLAEPELRIAGWQLWRNHPMWHAQPTPAHRALVALQQAGVLRGLLTQNFDGLHHSAGSTGVLELHGSLATTSCVTCRWRTDTRTVVDALDTAPDPHCPHCDGVLKPDIVYFGEILDDRVIEQAVAATQDSEIFLAIGTTLSVQPVASLAGLAVESGARLVVVNDAPTMYDELAERIIRDPIDQAVPALVAEFLDH